MSTKLIDRRSRRNGFRSQCHGATPFIHHTLRSGLSVRSSLINRLEIKPGTTMRQSLTTLIEILRTSINRLAYLNAYVKEGITMHSTRLKLAISHTMLVEQSVGK